MKILKNDVFILSLAVILVAFAFLIVVWIAFSPKKTTRVQTSESNQISGQFNLDYSRLDKISPGKSTIDDVEKINGLPNKISSFGNKTYLYYPTPSKDFTNKVLIQYGVVVYALENVFSLYRGYYSDYTSKLGNPDITLYDKNSESYPWYVFLKQGVAVQVSNNYVVALIYFSPQSESSFTNVVAQDLGLTSSSLPDVPESVIQNGR